MYMSSNPHVPISVDNISKMCWVTGMIERYTVQTYKIIEIIFQSGNINGHAHHHNKKSSSSSTSTPRLGVARLFTNVFPYTGCEMVTNCIFSSLVNLQGWATFPMFILFFSEMLVCVFKLLFYSMSF